MAIGSELNQNLENQPDVGPWPIDAAYALIHRTFHPLQVGGNIGPLWLILLPVAGLLLRWRDPATRVLWIATLVGALCWGSFVQFGRFLLPVLVPAAALCGATVARLTQDPRRSVRFVFSSLLLAIFAWNASILTSRLPVDRLRVATGQLASTEFLRQWNSSWPAVEVVNSLPASSRVLLVAESRSFYIKPPVVVEDPYRTPFLVDRALLADDTDALARALRSEGITHLLVNESEMPRFAALRGRSSYWEEADARTLAIIQELFSSRITRLGGNRDVWVGRLN